MKRLLLNFAFACSLFPLGAQQVLTLEECLQIGIENNLTLQSKRNEIIKGKHSISENRSKLLPQINAVASFNDNFNPPVSVTDGSAYGNPYNVTKTLQYNASAGLQLQMPLYNQTIYTAMSVTKMMDEINTLSYDKAREDLIMQITKMYYLGQSTAEQISIVKENITRLEELRDITTAFFDNGMAMEVDVKRVNINLENLQVQYDNAVAMLTQQINMLKYVIDYPAETDITLTPVDTESIIPVEMSGKHHSCRNERTVRRSAGTGAAEETKYAGRETEEDDFAGIYSFTVAYRKFHVLGIHRQGEELVSRRTVKQMVQLIRHRSDTQSTDIRRT